MNEQRRILYSGRVQGVGFRYTACRIAAGYDVGGLVRNLPDGRVECLVEGPTDQVQAFLDELMDRMSGHIADLQETKAPCTGEFDGKFGFR